ncbi:glycosyltransferase family 4 protein [Paenibacillus chartarius]|uniref:Glycosyltransferase family 4 protein n=1 Tax=Paenibacillus chartarius TaxID=747481 RepID=A0ABV6DLI4_9BACL
MNKIYINGRFLTQGTTGVQRYAIEVVKQLDDFIDNGEIDPDAFHFTLVAPKELRYELPLKHIKLKKVGRLRGHLWEQLELPFHCGGGLLVNLCNTGPLLKVPQIVTLHDASVFVNKHFFSTAFRLWYKVLFTILGKVAKRIITVSQFSKDELVRYCKIHGDKIHVTHLGKEHLHKLPADSSVFQKHQFGEKPYLLAVSSLNPNKNFKAILTAIQNLDTREFDVVIAGGTNLKVFADAELSVPDNVIQLGYVSDEELKALYERAACFVFPSFYEGFGIPPIEAMSFGCPVIVSNTASLPEVCGDAVIYCDPNDPALLGELIKKLMSDRQLRDGLVQKSLQRAGMYSWEKCTRLTYSILQEVVS